MANKTKTDDSLATTDNAGITKPRPDDKISLAEILGSLASPSDVDGSEWKVTIGSVDHYWPAEAGMRIRGNLLSVQERPTSKVIDGKILMARFYTLELTVPCLGMTRDGEMVELANGKLISILERAQLKRLEEDLGKEIVLVCDGKSTTKQGNPMWNYRSWAREPAKTEKPETVNTTGQTVSS